jgi:hypothetical protein
LNLDPTLQALLRDISISLKNPNKGFAKHKELEIVTGTDSGLLPGLSLKEWTSMEKNADIGDVELESRKSPAAIFGSIQIGSVILPQELRSAIEAIISGNSTFPILLTINNIHYSQKVRNHCYTVTPNGSFCLQRPRKTRVGGMHIMILCTGQGPKLLVTPSEMELLLPV